MIDLSVFGIDTPTAVAIFLTISLSEVIKKTVDQYNLKFEKSLFQHWHILMPLILSTIAALVVNIKYLTLTGYLESWAYIFAFSVVLYETVVRRIKSRRRKSNNDSQGHVDSSYITSPEQKPTITPCDVIYPSDGGK